MWAFVGGIWPRWNGTTKELEEDAAVAGIGPLYSGFYGHRRCVWIRFKL